MNRIDLSGLSHQMSLMDLVCLSIRHEECMCLHKEHGLLDNGLVHIGSPLRFECIVDHCHKDPEDILDNM